MCLLLLAIGACKKADTFYDELYSRPEVRINYNKVYGIGDTIKIQGRLNPERGLKIRIGNTDAVFAEIGKVDYTIDGGGTKAVIDEVKIVITEAMGIGVNRQITVTSSGIAIEATAIEIIQGSDNGVIPDRLKLIAHHKLPTGVVFLNCINGKGSIYFWNSANKTIQLIKKDGAASIVFTGSNLSDLTGNFSVKTFNGGGVDPQENALYFSCITEDAAISNNVNTIYRFIKVDLKSGIVTVLNTTVVPNAINSRSLAVVTPFEGSSNLVKLPLVTQVFPDSKGNMYLLIEDYALALLTKDGTFKYMYKVDLSTEIKLKIWNDSENREYFSSEIISLLPGLTLNTRPVSIEADEQVLYSLIPSSAFIIQQYDLADRIPLTLYSPTSAASSIVETPYISGSFSTLNYLYKNGPLPRRFGLLPLPEQQLISLYYQGETEANYNAFPAWGVLNFRSKRGLRYAPGKLIIDQYLMSNTDQLLNYDEAGMLYMSANERATLVKTTKQ